MISLVVPVYNMEKLLEKCLKTLLNQETKEYEIILVDDGSTDSSPKMCDEYAKSNPDKIRVIHKENGGLSSARNAGMKIANGKYVTFPDPDDWVEKGYVNRFEQLQTEYNADLVCIGHYVNYDEREIPVDNGTELKIFDKKMAQRALFMSPCINGFAWNKIFNMDIIRNYELTFLDDVGTTEDLDFVFRYLKYCNTIVFSPEDRLYHYYQREGAATNSSFSRKNLASINTYNKIINDSNDTQLMCAAKEEICNVAINSLFLFKDAKENDDKILEYIRVNLKDNLKYYLHSKRYGNGRKIQACMANYLPDVYVVIKKMFKNYRR